MLDGVLDLSWWGVALCVLVMTHITIASVTIFLHRHQAHRALDLHPAVSHFFRFWLWLTTGMKTIQWVAIHRKHHAYCDLPDDPHSPVQKGLSTVMRKGAELYRDEGLNNHTMSKYGYATPSDWLERNLYHKAALGLGLMLIIDLLLFGVIGLTAWAVQLMWIPVFAAGVINGMGHATGYRNFETKDASRNIVPWGILIGGEELHNNHHAYAGSAKLSSKPWEFDIGWMYIKTLEYFRLAKVNKLPPKVREVSGNEVPDLAMVVGDLMHNRLQVMAVYAKHVLKTVHANEMKALVGSERRRFKRVKRSMIRETARLSESSRERLQLILDSNKSLDTVYQYRVSLQNIWEQRSQGQERMQIALQEWCQSAEATGIKALQDFVDYIRRYAININPAASLSPR